MKRPLVLALVSLAIAVSGAGGFAVGFLYESQREMEASALQGLIQALATTHYLAKNDPQELAKSNNAFIDGLLTQLRINAGANTTPNWIRNKARTLNAIALHWEKRPPFENASWRTQPQEWTAAWEEGHRKNLELLEWARKECAAHPEYECKESL